MAIHRISASLPYLYIDVSTNQGHDVVIGLVDTGASITACHPRIIEILKPDSIGSVFARKVGEEGPVKLPTYLVRISLEPQAGIATREFWVEVVAKEPASPCDVLLGTDIMRRWMVLLDGDSDKLIIPY